MLAVSEPVPIGNQYWDSCKVLDPFMGSGTTGIVAKKLGRNFIGIDIKKEYIEIAMKRIDNIMECSPIPHTIVKTASANIPATFKGRPTT